MLKWIVRRRDQCVWRRTSDTEGRPQFGRSHDPHLCVSLEAPLKLSSRVIRYPSSIASVFRYDTAIAETRVVRQELPHALLYNRFAHRSFRKPPVRG